ncbi:MAG: hypothetical protein RL660_566 [Bacteroidota bacterium]|jgi:aminopeptidase N
MMKQLASTIVCFFLLTQVAFAQQFTYADTLRGTIGVERAWWDVLHYDIFLDLDENTKTIKGITQITFKRDAQAMAAAKNVMQIDLEQGLTINKIYLADNPNALLKSEVKSKRARFIQMPAMTEPEATLIVEYEGTPIEAVNPPWDGGISWKKDSKERPWLSVSCQGKGASMWYACKDHQSDEPDNGMNITIKCNKDLTAVANGRLIKSDVTGDKAMYTWQVKNPISTYAVSFYVGYYKSITAKYAGVDGPLDYTYWYLDYNEEKAKELFTKIPLVLKSFEYWFGAFPWYGDGYQLVEAPYLGMEHQSAIAYGNNYKNGYMGIDLTLTGIGLKFDHILVHESGHEWFGNSITTKDIADMWVQEGFTTFSEALYVETHFGKEKAERYIRGQRRSIQNERPIISSYGVNEEPPGDQYYKGSSILLMVRTSMNNDEKFRALLQHLIKKYGKTTVTSAEIEKEISTFSGIDFQPMFDQYLYTNEIPKLVIDKNKDEVVFTLTNCNEDLTMPYVFEHKGQTYTVQLKANTPVTLKCGASYNSARNSNYYFVF